MFLGLLLQGVPTPPNSPASLNWVWWLIIVLFVVATSLIVLLSKRREDVQVTNEKRAVAAEGLVKTRDMEINDLKGQCKKLEEKLEDLESENRVIAGVKLSELFKFWEAKTTIETDLEVTRSQLRLAQNTLKRLEKGTSPE